MSNIAILISINMFIACTALGIAIAVAIEVRRSRR